MIVEDGTVVTGADSYVSVQDVRDYASSRGITTLPLLDGHVEPLIAQAMDVVEGYSFKGVKTDPDNQQLSWPRKNVVFRERGIGFDEIPSNLIKAVAQLAIEAIENDLSPNRGGRVTTMEKVDVVEVEYYERGPASDRKIFSKAEEFLAPLLVSTSALRAIRL